MLATNVWLHAPVWHTSFVHVSMSLAHGVPSGLLTHDDGFAGWHDWHSFEGLGAPAA
jgi:hypothetical protein